MEEHSGNQEGPLVDATGDREAALREAMEGPFVSTDRVRFSLSTRRARIDPSKKRASFVRRLERIYFPFIHVCIIHFESEG